MEEVVGLDVDRALRAVGQYPSRGRLPDSGRACQEKDGGLIRRGHGRDAKGDARLKAGTLDLYSRCFCGVRIRFLRLWLPRDRFPMIV